MSNHQCRTFLQNCCRERAHSHLANQQKWRALDKNITVFCKKNNKVSQERTATNQDRDLEANHEFEELDDTAPAGDDYFHKGQRDRLFGRYAQALYAFQYCDEQCESYYALSSGLGALAGAVAIVALTFQALSYVGDAPAWCGLIGSAGNMVLSALSLVEGARGWEDIYQDLRTCRNEFGAAASELEQALCCQPHPRPDHMVKHLDKMFQSVMDKWNADRNFVKVINIGEKCHSEAEGVQDKLAEVRKKFEAITKLKPRRSRGYGGQSQPRASHRDPCTTPSQQATVSSADPRSPLSEAHDAKGQMPDDAKVFSYPERPTAGQGNALRQPLLGARTDRLDGNQSTARSSATNLRS